MTKDYKSLRFYVKMVFFLRCLASFLFLSSLSQDNVALIVVLESKVNNQPVDNHGKRQLLCVVSSFLLSISNSEAASLYSSWHVYVYFISKSYFLFLFYIPFFNFFCVLFFWSAIVISAIALNVECQSLSSHAFCISVSWLIIVRVVILGFS